MTDAGYFDDEVLTAYLDQEVDARTKRAIESVLDHDAVLQGRLSALRVPVAALQEAADDLLEASPQLPDLEAMKTPGRHGGGKQRYALAACLVLGLLFGAAVMAWRPKHPDGWMEYVAAYQALYVHQTLASVAPTPEAAATNLAALGARLGRDLSAAQPYSGLEFKRGQILGYRGKTLVQLAYLNASGDPVALCIIQGEGEGRAGISQATLEGMAAAFWEKDGFAFLLIGGADAALIEATAERMSDRL